jgi:N6-adenosine-specific RNA methylase IME4/ParB-like chromosome segregation protein Spo0J
VPVLEGEAFKTLVADIRANGLLQPITLHEGAILDGRNRLKACKAAGIEPQFVDYEGNDPLAFVISMNVRRRHLDESQRSLIASRLANMRRDERTDLQPSANLRKVSQAEAAERLNVSERSVTSAALVDNKATPALVQAVEQGKIAISLAAKLVTASEAVQRQAAAEPERAHVLVKQSARIERETQLAVKQQALPEARYGVIYADPPWRFEPYSRDTGLDRAADNHYPVMDLAAIKALDVASITAPDAVLFLWATAPMLPEALDVMAAWGFEYRTNFVWAKDRAGTGYWSRNQHEHLLVGVKGDIPAPAPGQQWPSVIEAPVREHSRKPDEARRMIETLFPHLPKIELFARTARAGWTVWGQEAPAKVEEERTPAASGATR